MAASNVFLRCHFARLFLSGTAFFCPTLSPEAFLQSAELFKTSSTLEASCRTSRSSWHSLAGNQCFGEQLPGRFEPLGRQGPCILHHDASHGDCLMAFEWLKLAQTQCYPMHLTGLSSTHFKTLKAVGWKSGV